MKINTNTAAMFAMRAQNVNQPGLSNALRRLSSGLRVNSARDDAAGLAIAERFTSRIRGLDVAMRNANDGVSLLQTAEGGLIEITNIMQRMRELSVQAANTAVIGAQERGMIQEEIQQLKSEITRVAKSTEFNGVRLLDDGAKHTLAAGGDRYAVVQGLARAWLRESEDMIATYYGLAPNGATLTIDLDSFTDGAYGTLARAGASLLPGVGNASNQVLQIDMADFTNIQVPGDGGSVGPVAYDRIIAHEMVHAIMYNQVDMTILPKWFVEGTAELIHGADERVTGDYVTATIDGVDATDFATDGINLSGAWGGTSAEYAKGYLAARYLHSKAVGGMKAVMAELHAGKTLDQAIAATTVYADEATFLADFSLNASFSAASFNDTDTGAIGGVNADGIGSRLTTGTDVVPNSDQLEANPTNFNVVFPFSPLIDMQEGFVGSIVFQVGSNVGDELRIGTSSATAQALGVDKVDLVNDPQSAIGLLDYAIAAVTKERARFGAQMSRMESAIRSAEVDFENSSAARSRILDTDYARETLELARTKIVDDAATAMIASAQQSSRLVLNLLA